MNTESNEYWESFSNNINFIRLSEADEGDTWEGWFHDTRQGAKGMLLEIRNHEQQLITMPYAGALKSQLENHMKVQKWDYIRIEYKGTVQITEGTWKGQDCHQFLSHRNLGMSGEDQYRYHTQGVPLPEKPPKTEPVDSDVVTKERDDVLNGMF